MPCVFGNFFFSSFGWIVPGKGQYSIYYILWYLVVNSEMLYIFHSSGRISRMQNILVLHIVRVISYYSLHFSKGGSAVFFTELFLCQSSIND